MDKLLDSVTNILLVSQAIPYKTGLTFDSHTVAIQTAAPQAILFYFALLRQNTVVYSWGTRRPYNIDRECHEMPL
jgi:hypothetical protein